MEANEIKQTVAQGAAVWNEREMHEQIMTALSNVKGVYYSYFYINGNCNYWHIDQLPEGMPEQIAQRGNHEEIMYMIHQYGKTIRPSGPFCGWRIDTEQDGGALLSDEVQEIILMRNNPAEIDAFTTYHGFNIRGQEIILQRGNHEEIMRYVERHGFAPRQQHQLRQRGCKEEIDLHIARHGWCSELLDNMFKQIEDNGNYDEFYNFVSKHELSIPYQQWMLKTVSKEGFEFYISHHGLWNETHAEMVRQRSEEEILHYIMKHRYLCFEAEHALAQRRSHKLNMAYVNCRVNGKNLYFVDELMSVDPIDYEALSVFFLQDVQETYPISSREEIELMKSGSHEEVMKRIDEKELGFKSLAALFFRNNQEEFEAYVQKWIRK